MSRGKREADVLREEQVFQDVMEILREAGLTYKQAHERVQPDRKYNTRRD